LSPAVDTCLVIEVDEVIKNVSSLQLDENVFGKIVAVVCDSERLAAQTSFDAPGVLKFSNSTSLDEYQLSCQLLAPLKHIMDHC
jgi:hypothetical protein